MKLNVKGLLKSLFPEFLLDFYHRSLSFFAAFLYRHPSEEMIVIGVTGTKGKTTVTHLIARMLEQAGYKVGLTSTVAFKIGQREWLNPLKMTMPGRFYLQRLLRQMADDGCRYAVIESSSEGVMQFRHRYIHYDVMVFTNLTPEHLEHHGGFENYKQAKLEFFRRLAASPHKSILGKKISKAIIANGEDKYASEFLAFPVDKKMAYISSGLPRQSGADVKTIATSSVVVNQTGIRFAIETTGFQSGLKGQFNVENSLAAIAASQALGVSLKQCAAALATVSLIPGRMENIAAGQNFTVIVDYAHEPNSLAALYGTVAAWPKRRLIQVLGSAGGLRDKSRRAVIGEMAGRACDIVVVTNEDAFDEDPAAIIKAIAIGAQAAGKIPEKNLFLVPDRRQGIRKALALASAGDLVLITGKGTEQKMALFGGEFIPWDDRTVTREELRSLLNSR